MSYSQPADSGKRLVGFLFVALLHVLAVYALVNGLNRTNIQVIHQPMEAKIIEEVKTPPPDTPPPRPPPRLVAPQPPRLAAPQPPYIPLPEVQVQLLPVAQQNTAAEVASVKPAAPVPSAAPREVVAVPMRFAAAVVEASACDKPQYPPAALRAEETGVVGLAFLIETDGKVVDSRVERSSGSRRLDEAARKALGLCKFRPATVDGKPEKSWAKIEYEWRIE